MKKSALLILLVVAILMLAINLALLWVGFSIRHMPQSSFYIYGAAEGPISFNISFSADMIAAGVAGLTSLLFAYFPGLNTWYASLRKDYESLIMIGLMAVVALVIALLQPAFPTWQIFVQTFIAAIILNASTYVHLPETPAVIAAKAKRALAAIPN